MDNHTLEMHSLLKYMVQNGRNVDVGCGPRKVHPSFIGVDPIKSGDQSHLYMNCVADMEGTGRDINKLFAPNSIDFICAAHTVHYDDDLVATLKSWYDACKPGGIAAIVDLDECKWKEPSWMEGDHMGKRMGWSFYWRTLEETKLAGEAAGFITIECGPSAPAWSYIWAGRKPELLI